MYKQCCALQVHPFTMGFFDLVSPVTMPECDNRLVLSTPVVYASSSAQQRLMPSSVAQAIFHGLTLD